MKIVIISDDTALCDTCSEMVSRLNLQDSEIVIGSQCDSSSGDLFVWDLDCDPVIPLEAGYRQSKRDLFVVQRNHLDTFLDRFPHAAASIALKPVNPAVLEAFLDQLTAQPKVQEQENLESAFRADRDALLQCLMRASLRLQEFEQNRTNFWARAAHDLRTPLTAASGYCELVLEERMGPLNREQKELLERAQHSLRKLIRMASAMFQLTVGKQVEGKLMLKRVRIQDCLKDAVREIQGFADEKNISLTVHLGDPGRQLYIEPVQIEQVMVNLLENACKFTPRDGAIQLRGYPVPWRGTDAAETIECDNQTDARSDSYGGYRVDVSDSGPGIAVEHLDHIFEEYVSYGDSERSAGGLGLAICRMILRAHHGEIWAETTESGATFSFVIPFNPPVIQQRTLDMPRSFFAASVS
jgi:signal transduction histidine kinase